MDWDRIEKDLNLHALSLSHDTTTYPRLTRSYSNIGYPRPSSSYDAQIMGSSSQQLWNDRENHIANQSFHEEMENGLSRRNVATLIQEVGGMTKWATQTEKRVDNIDHILVMLTHNIEDMSKGYEEIAVNCRNLHQESRMLSKTLQQINKERSSSLLQYDSITHRINDVEEGLKYHEEEYASKSYVSQMLDAVTGQIKAINSKVSSTAGISSQQMDRLVQQLQKLESKVHDDSLQVLRVEADNRRAKDSMLSEIKATRDVVNLFTNDIKEIREIQSSQSKQIDLLLSNRREDSKIQKTFERFEAELKQSNNNNLILTKRVEMLENMREDQKVASSQEVEKLQLAVNGLNDRSSSFEQAVTNLSRMVEGSTQSMLIRDKDILSRLEELERIQFKLKEDRQQLSSSLEAKITILHDRIEETTELIQEQEEMITKQIKSQLVDLQSKVEDNLSTRQLKGDELKEELEGTNILLRDLESRVTVIKNISDHSKDQIQLMTASIDMNISEIANLRNRVEENITSTTVDLSKIHENIRSTLTQIKENSTRSDTIDEGLDALIEVVHQLEKRADANDRLLTDSEKKAVKLESSVTSFRQALDSLQEELLHVSEILQAKEKESIAQKQIQSKEDDRKERVQEECLAAISDLELKVLRLQEQALTTEEVLSNMTTIPNDNQSDEDLTKSSSFHTSLHSKTHSIITKTSPKMMNTNSVISTQSKGVVSTPLTVQTISTNSSNSNNDNNSNNSNNHHHYHHVSNTSISYPIKKSPGNMSDSFDPDMDIEVNKDKNEGPETESPTEDFPEDDNDDDKNTRSYASRMNSSRLLEPSPPIASKPSNTAASIHSSPTRLSYHDSEVRDRDHDHNHVSHMDIPSPSKTSNNDNNSNLPSSSGLGGIGSPSWLPSRAKSVLPSIGSSSSTSSSSSISVASLAPIQANRGPVQSFTQQHIVTSVSSPLASPNSSNQNNIKSPSFSESSDRLDTPRSHTSTSSSVRKRYPRGFIPNTHNMNHNDQEKEEENGDDYDDDDDYESEENEHDMNDYDDRYLYEDNIPHNNKNQSQSNHNVGSINVNTNTNTISRKVENNTSSLPVSHSIPQKQYPSANNATVTKHEQSHGREEEDSDTMVEAFDMTSPSSSPKSQSTTFTASASLHSSSTMSTSNPIAFSSSGSGLRQDTVQCNYCMRRVGKNELVDHMKTCDLRMEVCPHGCGTKLRWTKMQQHIDSCPLKPNLADEDFDDDD